MCLKIIAPSRLHLGLLTDGYGERPWQGIGLAIKEPKTILRAEYTNTIGIRFAGKFDKDLESVLNKFYSKLNTNMGFNLEIVECPPRHVGLGSGTQIILSAATAILSLAGMKKTVEEVALATGRGRYSWIGVEVFRNGGFIISLGRGKNNFSQPVIRLDFPEDWFIVVSIPRFGRGLSGFIEENTLSQIRYSEETVISIHKCLMNKILPGIIEHDLELFGKGIELVQRLVGNAFKNIQGGVFHTASMELVEMMADAGLHGVGQSSWGPAIYGFIDKREDAQAAVQLIKNLSPDINAFITTAENRGAKIVYG